MLARELAAILMQNPDATVITNSDNTMEQSNLLVDVNYCSLGNFKKDKEYCSDAFDHTSYTKDCYKRMIADEPNPILCYRIS
jgi:hypothetical protein